jgi:hypothetical protein
VLDVEGCNYNYGGQGWQLLINKKDGLFEAKPMKIHLQKLQRFLLFYDSKSRDMYGPIDEEDVIGIQKISSSRIVAHLNFDQILQTVTNH